MSKAHYTGSEAVAILHGLEYASKECLSVLKIPFRPQGKTRPWKFQGGPVGLGIHYTGGVCPVRSMEWFNNPDWGNKKSSCHCIVFDQMIPRLEDIWPKFDIANIFKVPTILLADLGRGTHHINWANNRLFGIENRNAGYHGYANLEGGLPALNKIGYHIKDRIYEEYTREQVAANIELGRLWLAIRRDKFDPKWICGHSQIWAVKADPGPVFPNMHNMRAAIWGDQKIDDIDFLQSYQTAKGFYTDAAMDLFPPYDDRSDPEKSEQFWKVNPVVTPVPSKGDRPGVAGMLYLLGWPVDLRNICDEELREFIVYFQRSTLAYNTVNKPHKVLKVDGICGPKTMASLIGRLKSLRLR